MASIIIAMPKAEDAKKISDLLKRYGIGNPEICTTAASALLQVNSRESGVVVFGSAMKDMHYSEFIEYIPENFEILLLAPLMELNNTPPGLMVITYPFKAADLLNTVEMQLENIRRRIKKKKSQPKKRSPEEQKYIDDAKALLMERNHLTEPEAFRYIQKCSMDSGTNLVETAQMILLLVSDG